MRKVLVSIVAILLIASIALSCGPVEPEPEPEPEVRATIIRDDYGVPHVFADTKEDLAYGAGYAMAQDRLWQADVLRRASTGRLAELGLATVEEDAATRTLWYSEAELQQMYDDWDPGTGYEHLKPMIEAYVEGINRYIYDAHLDPYLMPIEYYPLGYTAALEDFTVSDVVALTVLMGWQFGGTGGSEGDIYEALLTLQAMHGDNATGSAIWSDVFPLNDAGAPVTIPATGCESLTTFSTDVTLPDVPDNLSGVLEGARQLLATHNEAFKSLGIPTRFGSNAVPVSGNLSESGNTLELGGPQMGYTIPQIIYELGLHGAGINAQGMAIAAAGPFILIGVGEYGAWTSTTGASDVIDVRILGLNPVNPFQYWHDGAWVDMEARIETIYDGDGVAHNVTCYRSVYGPVIEIDPIGHQGVTLHVPYFKNEIAGEQSWQLFQEATNIEEFEDAVELTWPNHNFYWAGTDGDIGYWHAGRFPVKPGAPADRRLPLMGDGTQEWVRITGPEEMPRCINPDQGWMANWNNKPIAGWQYAESDIHWGEGHRVQILMGAMAGFAAAGDLTTDTLNQLNQIGGYHSTAGMNFASNVTAVALASTNATVQAAGSYLAAWATATPPISYVDLVSPMWPTNPDPTYDNPGLTIFNAWYDRIGAKVFAGILTPDLIGQVKSYPSLLIRVFRGDTLSYPFYPTGATLTTMIEDALKEAIDYLTAEYGSSDMSTWLTPVRMQVYEEQGALPADAFEHPYMNRGTYTQIAELVAGGEPTGLSCIPPGQSGFMWLDIVGGKTPTPTPSPHAYDQVELYASWTYKSMLFTLAAVEAVEESRTVLYVEE